MDPPGGARISWGASRLPGIAAPRGARSCSGRFFGTAPQRLLGPVEYLTVWHLQRTQRTALGADTFRTALSRMIALLNRSDDARTLYPRKPAADAPNELEGAYTRSTRHPLQAIAAPWQPARSPAEHPPAPHHAPAAATPT